MATSPRALSEGPPCHGRRLDPRTQRPVFHRCHSDSGRSFGTYNGCLGWPSLVVPRHHILMSPALNIPSTIAPIGVITSSVFPGSSGSTPSCTPSSAHTPLAHTSLMACSCVFNECFISPANCGRAAIILFLNSIMVSLRSGWISANQS